MDPAIAALDLDKAGAIIASSRRPAARCEGGRR
jgi:hypothetical protein